MRAVRAVRAASGSVGQAWPSLVQVSRVERRRTVSKHGVWHDTAEVTYAATSLPATTVDARTLLGPLRGHWGI